MSRIRKQIKNRKVVYEWKIFEEYSVKIYEIDPYSYDYHNEKIKVDKNEREYILFRTDQQNHEDRKLIFEKKDKRR